MKCRKGRAHLGSLLLEWLPMLLFWLGWARASAGPTDDGSRETLEQAGVLPGGRVLHSNTALPLRLPRKSQWDLHP